MLELYKNIKKRRVELGMSQEELAKKVGYTSRSTIARIERGDIDLSQSKIMEIAKALKTTASDLLGFDGIEGLEGVAEIDATLQITDGDIQIIEGLHKLSGKERRTMENLIKFMLDNAMTEEEWNSQG